MPTPQQITESLSELCISNDIDHAILISISNNDEMQIVCKDHNNNPVTKALLIMIRESLQIVAKQKGETEFLIKRKN